MLIDRAQLLGMGWEPVTRRVEVNEATVEGIILGKADNGHRTELHTVVIRELHLVTKPVIAGNWWFFAKFVDELGFFAIWTHIFLLQLMIVNTTQAGYGLVQIECERGLTGRTVRQTLEWYQMKHYEVSCDHP
jgi:hypothetical protein